MSALLVREKTQKWLTGHNNFYKQIQADTNILPCDRLYLTLAQTEMWHKQAVLDTDMAQTQMEPKNTQYVTQTHGINTNRTKAHTSCTWHSNMAYIVFDTNRKMAQTMREAHREKGYVPHRNKAASSPLKKEKKKRKPINTIHAENWLYLKCFLKVVVFLQEHAIVHDNLWGSDAQVQDTVVHSFAWLQTQQSHKMPSLSLLECHQ